MARAPALPISFGSAYHSVIAKGGLREGETVLVHAAAEGVDWPQCSLRVEQEPWSSPLRAAGAADRTGRKSCHRPLAQDVVEEARRLTGAQGVDLVTDPVGPTLQTSLSALAPEGRFVFLGNAGGGKLEVDLWQPMRNNPIAAWSVHGASPGETGRPPNCRRPPRSRCRWGIQVVIDRTFALQDASKAHDYAETGRPLGRVIMTP
ncbi:NADPH:quinone reductase-like Zn-dependent oxidoreductase [Neorhizobium sp. 2083]|nr:NADPH:quinone reductase-like Zn-dependent oxidoreductase [Neorhizobium sp. 2083]